MKEAPNFRRYKFISVDHALDVLATNAACVDEQKKVLEMLPRKIAGNEKVRLNRDWLFRVIANLAPIATTIILGDQKADHEAKQDEAGDVFYIDPEIIKFAGPDQ